MKFRHFIFQSTIGLLRIISVVYFLTAFFALTYAVFDVKPYIEFNNQSKFGLVDFAKGITVPVKGNLDYPSGLADKPFARFQINHYINHRDQQSDIGTVNEIQLSSGNLFLKTNDISIRLLLLAPAIIYFVALAMAAWQISKLLDDVLEYKSFSLSNSRRIRNVGWLIILPQLVLLFYNVSTSGFWSVNAQYPLMINSGNHAQFDVRPDYEFSIGWLLAGIMLLIIAMAFKDGNTLQQDQDLTI